MEWFQNYRVARYGVGIVVLFLVSSVKSCTELKRSLWGVTTAAKVVEAKPSTNRSGNQFLRLTFPDESGVEQAIKLTTTDRTRQVITGESIDVIYISGQSADAIPLAERSMAWPIVLGVMTGIGVIWMLVMMREAKAGRGV